MTNEKKVVIVGSGIFGVSTALWMLKKGGYSITVLDKSKVLPAPDAASTDLNKVIRNGDYADPHIARLNVDAVDEWRKPEWEGTYHESGVMCLGNGNKDASTMEFVDSSYRNCEAMGVSVVKTPSSKEILAALPSHLHSGKQVGSFQSLHGYMNIASGWAEAGRALEVGIKRIKKMGAVVRSGSEVTGLLESGEVITGVKLASGEIIDADLVVVAAGAWTPALFAQPGMGGLPTVVATGQCVATIQLTPSEAETYKKVPVLFDFSTGYYVFPPNPQGVIKMAFHSAGYLNYSNPENVESTNEKESQLQGVSVPRTKLTPGASDGFIPKEMIANMRAGLTKFYPELGATKDFSGTRLCWYADTADGDWLIDWHPAKKNLMLATAGCGHAFKFFPNIGREVLAKIEGTIAKELEQKWAFEGRQGQRDASTNSDARSSVVRKLLKPSDLATNEDLKAPRVKAKL